jgi:hypothetical protein
VNGQCTYTGARVLFLDYGFVAPADLYLVDSTVVIRWNEHCPQHAFTEADVTHQVITRRAWHRPDIGVTVVALVDCHGPAVKP